jgi:hypothetical protein
MIRNFVLLEPEADAAFQRQIILRPRVIVFTVQLDDRVAKAVALLPAGKSYISADPVA